MILNFFKNNKGEVVIFQPPNAPLLAAIFLYLLKYFDNNLLILSRAGFFIVMLYWCGLEIVYGDSPFRRFLGIVVAIFIIWQILPF